MATVYKGYTIRKSGKEFWRVINPRGHQLQPRVRTLDGAYALIVAQGRVMTRTEHALVHHTAVAAVPTAAQLVSENDVREGRCEGFLE